MIAAFISAAPRRRLLLLGHFDKTALPNALLTRTDAVPFNTYETYLAALARADCAVMPLADDQFNQCKSAVRVIDAAAVSIPSVVSHVGDLSTMVLQGETGFVARTPKDWLTHLTSLADDPLRTAQMGASARYGLETQWSGRDNPSIVDPEILKWVQT